MKICASLVILCSVACARGSQPPESDTDSISAAVTTALDSAPLPSNEPATTDTALSGQTPPAATSAPDTVEGSVVVTGMGPSTHATLALADGSLMLGGPLEPELRQLSGARVAVYGDATSTGRPGIDVRHYDIIAIDGQRPVVGTVLPDGARLAAGADTLSVTGVTERLPAGAKVWIVGRRDGDELRLQSWGVLRR